jgi:MinD-like ATPase involved in chromosome partitioning or flagellar assembly
LGDLLLEAAAVTPPLAEELGPAISANGRPGPRGALAAVCGVCGGAGATTVAYLVARSAAREGEEPVLVCDLGGVGAGLGECAGVESPLSLPGLANAIGAGEEPLEGVFAHGGDGLRVLAHGPRFEQPPDPEGLLRVLQQSREAHGLTVVDCGVPGGSRDEVVLAAATHVLWVLPVRPSAARRSRRLLGLFPGDASRAEVVVAREDVRATTKAATEELADLAAERRAPLVLVPHVGDLGESGPEQGLAAAALSLDAIRSVLDR